MADKPASQFVDMLEQRRRRCQVGCVLIREDDEDVLRNIARYSNTQEALDDWDFHADSDEMLLLKNNLGRIKFTVLGVDRSFTSIKIGRVRVPEQSRQTSTSSLSKQR